MFRDRSWNAVSALPGLLEERFEFLVAHVTIREDLRHQTRPDGLPRMNRNNGNATVHMLKEVVASLCTGNFKSGFCEMRTISFPVILGSRLMMPR
jgi:hypothetical protein